MFIQKEVRKNVSRSRTKKLNEMSFEQRARDLEEQEREEQKIEGRKKSPFSRFYQINKDNSDYLRSCLDENPKALKLLLFIFDHMDKYNAVICSYKVFQETLGMGQATVARCVKYLKDHGFLYVYKTGTSNVYVANKNLVWNSWGIMSNIANFQQILFYLHQSKKNVLKCVINVSRQYR